MDKFNEIIYRALLMMLAALARQYPGKTVDEIIIMMKTQRHGDEPV